MAFVHRNCLEACGQPAHDSPNSLNALAFTVALRMSRVPHGLLLTDECFPLYGNTNVFTSVNSPALRMGTRIVSLFSFGVFSFVMMVTCATVISAPLFPLP
ncbi:hypothetical protein B0G71_6777 [Paraburkholderia sp. BL27I4N3]|nr:hypothetical protein B0G71_6777 [Paraburkholderia sp. BL27I4N3]